MTWFNLNDVIRLIDLIRLRNYGLICENDLICMHLVWIDLSNLVGVIASIQRNRLILNDSVILIYLHVFDLI